MGRALARTTVVALRCNHDLARHVERMLKLDARMDPTEVQTILLNSFESHPLDERFLRIAINRPTDPCSCHPSLGERFRALGLNPARLTMPRPIPPHRSAAARWLGERTSVIRARLAAQAHGPEAEGIAPASTTQIGRAHV